jgi:LPXTG-site transpeptidase (sortase) family protein
MARRSMARVHLDKMAAPAHTVRQQVAAKRMEPSDDRAEHRMLQVALGLSTIGLCLIVFLAYVFVFTGLQEARTQRQLLELFQSKNMNLKNHLLTGTDVAQGQPEAVLEIPSIGLLQVVVKGTSSTDLLSGPGLMPDTARPGTKGNAVIAGRRSTAGSPFSRLLSLRPGEGVTVVTGLGRFLYRIERVGTAFPGASDPIAPSRTAELTLVTSNPPIFPTGRAYVVAKLISQPAVAPVPHTRPSESQRGLAGDPSAVLPTIVWGLILLGGLALTISAYRRWASQIWAVYLVSTPIVLAIALLWFENLYRLLPATL